jgi:hypothetical protein
MEPFPDFGGLSNSELKALIDKLVEEEHGVSYRRRLLHGKIDTLRAELITRLREPKPESDRVPKGWPLEKLLAALMRLSDEGDRRILREHCWPWLDEEDQRILREHYWPWLGDGEPPPGKLN